MKKLFLVLLVGLISCGQEEELNKNFFVEGSTFNYVNSDCHSSNPELNECNGFIFFHSSNKASGILNGGDIVDEFTYIYEDNTVFLMSLNSDDSEAFKIASKDILIRKTDKTSWERSGLVFEAE